MNGLSRVPVVNRQDRPGLDGCRLAACGLQPAVHSNAPRDLSSGVGERIGEAEREGMKNCPEAVSRPGLALGTAWCLRPGAWSWICPKLPEMGWLSPVPPGCKPAPFSGRQRIN